MSIKDVIKLNEDYGLHADDLNLTLCHRRVNTTEGSPFFGKETYVAIGYYGNVESLLKALVNKRIMLEAKQQQTLEALAASVDQYVSKLHNDLVKIVATLR